MNNKAKSIQKEVKEERYNEKLKFRGKLGPRNYSMLDRDPNFEYRWVDTNQPRYTDEYEKVEEYIDKGWSVVYDTKKPIDERTMANDNSNEATDRSKPITKKVKLGLESRTQILMKIPKEQREKNELAKAARDKAEKDAAINAKSATRQGNHLKVVQQDVNLTNKLED